LSCFNVTPPPSLYTLSLHDAFRSCHWRAKSPKARPVAPRPIAPSAYSVPALRPIDHPCLEAGMADGRKLAPGPARKIDQVCAVEDRKSTRLNSSHVKISYAVFCLK